MKCLHKLKVRAVAYTGMSAFAFVDSITRRDPHLSAASYGLKLSITTWMSKHITEDEFDDIFPTQEPDAPKQK